MKPATVLCWIALTTSANDNIVDNMKTLERFDLPILSIRPST